MKRFLLFLCFVILFTTAQAELPTETFYTANTACSGFVDDAYYGPFAIGFDFTFFGETKTQFYVSTNGLVGFTSSGMSSYNNTPLPNASTIPDDIIAPFWGDQNTNSDGAIYYRMIGTAPNREMVIQFTNMKCRTSGRSEYLGTYQVIMYETSNEIQMQYRILSDPNSSHVKGAGAAIGLENSHGDVGVQYSYHTASLSNEQAIHFTPSGGTYTMNSSATYEGVLLGAQESPPPAIPVLLAPGNNVSAPQNVTLSWTAVTGATTYKILYDDESYVEFATTAFVGDTTQYTIPATLTNGVTYYWRVHAINSTDTTWSLINKFVASTSPTLTISGNVGIANAILSWTDGSAKADTADASGDYSFTVSYGWSGTVTPSLTDCAFTPTSRTYTAITDNQADQDYTAIPNFVTISGNAGVAGAILSWTDGSVKTDTADGSGNYSFNVSMAWSGTVTPSKTGYTFTPTNKVYSEITTNQTSQNYTATAIVYTISGSAGVANAILSWTDGSAKADTADAEGSYSFTVSYNWSGTVTPSLTGYSFTPTSRIYTNVTANQTSQNYTATPNTITISGNAGVSSVLLSYFDGTAKVDTAGKNGDYSFTVSYNWSGTVTPSLMGYTFEPTSRIYTELTSNQTEQNYTATLVLYTIFGSVGGLEDIILTFEYDGLKADTSNTNGFYLIRVPQGWSGAITPYDDHYYFVPSSRTYTEIDDNLTGQNFTPYAAVLISGTILDESEDPIEGVYLSGMLDSVFTDEYGYYQGQVASGFTGSITASKESYTFLPDQLDFTDITVDQTDQDFLGTVIIVGIGDDQNQPVPTEYALMQNYPNPFNPYTTFRFDLPERANVLLEVYNIVGQRIATLTDAEYSAGIHLIGWDASNVASGLYFYRMTAGQYTETRKMMLLK